MGYGQYGFMAALAVIGIAFSVSRALPAALPPARWQAAGFAALFGALFAYSVWRLFKHFSRYR
jgi:hypothetical protein